MAGASSVGWAGTTASQLGIPTYTHVFVIVDGNKDYDQVSNDAYAPNLARFATTYGSATLFYGEVHPSEANYVSHTVGAPHIGQQLERSGRTWKGYYEDLPAPGSPAVVAGEVRVADGIRPADLYASKHSGFMNFASVQTDPRRAEHIVGFDRLSADLASGALANFALIVPNQCNEMHGLYGPGLPPGCDAAEPSALIRRGDAVIGELVAKLQATKAWNSSENVAIVITFDEGTGKARGGCCSVTPGAPSNYGGGHIPTVVVTNHGPRGIQDPTPYNHYSLLRTVEDVFGLKKHLERSDDTEHGVLPMTPLFRLR